MTFLLCIVIAVAWISGYAMGWLAREEQCQRRHRLRRKMMHMQMTPEFLIQQIERMGDTKQDYVRCGGEALENSEAIEYLRGLTVEVIPCCDHCDEITGRCKGSPE